MGEVRQAKSSKEKGGVIECQSTLRIILRYIALI